MALAAVGSKPSSRTRAMRLRISAFTSWTSLSALALPPRDAVLRRASSFSGAWDQQSPCWPLAGSLQRSPLALVARHWLICCLPFYWKVGGRSGSLKGVQTNSTAVRYQLAPPTTRKSDGLWVGLQVEEPSAVQDLRTVEVQAPYGVSERALKPQAFEVHYLLGVCQG